MKICTVSFKECWRNTDGQWYSDGGFPLQVAAIGDLFDQRTLVIVEVEARPGGIPFPEGTAVFPLRSPKGIDFRRKLSVIAQLPYYLGAITRHISKADAVYLPIPGDLPFLGLLLALALRKRAIVRYGSSWATNSRTTLMNRVTKTILRWSAGGRTVVLIAGKGDTEPAPRMHWHPPTSLSQAELDNIDARPDRALQDPPHLVCIGRLSPEKNVPRLIRALSLLKREGFQPLPRLTVLGGGPDSSRLEALAQSEGVQEIVHFAGQVDRIDLSRYLQQADICIHPSLTEASAGAKAWLDAMAHGVPVLACEVGGARWTIGADGERGWLAPQGSVEVFAAALRRVLTEPCDWPGLRRRARAYAETRTLETWREQVAAICSRQWEMALENGKLRSKSPHPLGRGSGSVRDYQALSTSSHPRVQQAKAE